MTNTKKIRVVSILLIAVIIISAGAAITVVRNQEVKSVSGISMESNSASSVIVRWDNVKRADGYYIYYCNGKSSDNGKGKYERLGKVDGGRYMRRTGAELSGKAPAGLPEREQY